MKVRDGSSDELFKPIKISILIESEEEKCGLYMIFNHTRVCEAIGVNGIVDCEGIKNLLKCDYSHKWEAFNKSILEGKK